MAALIRSIDWSATPLGPVSSWSPTLRMMVPFLVANRFPLLLWWGPDYCQIYNDAYRPILGSKHPRSMGQPTRECWTEIWDVLGPLIDTPYRGGAPTWMEDLALEINRHGFLEETHFTVAYSPVPDDTAPGGIGGVLATVHEISEKVVGERRVRALRDLAAGGPEAKTVEEACSAAGVTLEAIPQGHSLRARLPGRAGWRARDAGVRGGDRGGWAGQPSNRRPPFGARGVAPGPCAPDRRDAARGGPRGSLWRRGPAGPVGRPAATGGRDAGPFDHGPEVRRIPGRRDQPKAPVRRVLP
ncbi:MAG TPA: hypothetical protein VFT93_06240 [Candidatus Eisenbacteria bacterium]|nr:hypothetical protein [Candidatus Eisenbacteria bacterium]